MPSPCQARRFAFACVAALTLLTHAGSAAAQEQVTLEAPAEAASVTIARGAGPAPVLSACLFTDRQGGSGPTVSQQDFATGCVVPYINGAWLDGSALLRPLRELASQAARTVVRPRGAPVPIYYPAPLDAVLAPDLDALLAGETDVAARALPDPPPPPSLADDVFYNAPGLLFLPNPYVAAGNDVWEMRGWHSFFVIEGLLASADYVMRNPTARIWLPATQQFVTLSDDPRREAYFERYANELFRAAKGMVDNLIFEISFYGGHVLAANRPYAMTRSAPPLFTSAVRSVLASAERHDFEYVETLAPYLSAVRPGFAAPKSWDDWVRSEVLPAAERDYRYWTDPAVGAGAGNPRVVEVRLGDQRHPVYRYAAEGVGPAPEAVRPAAGPPSDFYARVASALQQDGQRNDGNRFHNRNRICFGAVPTGNCGDPVHRLTPEYYAADRAVRASGTRSGRFGVYGELALDYAALDLNALLYRAASDIDALSESVGLPAAAGADGLAARRAFLKAYFARPSGGFGDRFVDPVRPAAAPLFTYPHALQFAVLWAGVLDDREAVRSLLQALARPSADGPGFLTVPEAVRFGMPASLSTTDEAWDGPLGWAPIQFYAAEGLLDAGAVGTATTVMRQWLAAVNAFFAATGETLPVYDTADPRRDPRASLAADAAREGEAWTNAVYMIFIDALATLP